MKSVVKLRGTLVNKVLCSVLSSLNTIFVDVDNRLNVYRESAMLVYIIVFMHSVDKSNSTNNCYVDSFEVCLINNA